MVTMTTKKKTKKASKSVQKAKRAAVRSPRAAMSVATSGSKSMKERVAALAETPQAVCENDESLQAVLKILRSKEEPVEVRLAALQSLQAAAFNVIDFESCRSDYIATLRELSSDPDPEIRRRSLGILAREKDGFAQKKLLDGLKNPAKAMVSPEKALQLLGNDPHAEAYAAARAIVSEPPSEDARREALRLLSADATSAPIFEKLLRDKDELRDVRQISASALNALKPERLQEHARAMLLDTSEYEDIQATSLTALTQFGDDEAVGNDKALMKSVGRLGEKAKSAKYKKSARAFVTKYAK
jgi:HEAT repeat protein